jgi:hypothetical protein
MVPVSASEATLPGRRVSYRDHDYVAYEHKGPGHRPPGVHRPDRGCQLARPKEPVLALEVEGDARAYPLQILMWHEIVNDVVGGMPVAITFCPLCNVGIVFGRVLDGATLDFGTSGKRYKSDLVMYDRQSHSLWAQMEHRAIVGARAGAPPTMIPANTGLDPRRPPKERVVGVKLGQSPRAYPWPVLVERRVMHDRLDDRLFQAVYPVYALRSDIEICCAPMVDRQESRPPRAGRQTEQVLSDWLGLSAQAVAALKADGAR